MRFRSVWLNLRRGVKQLRLEDIEMSQSLSDRIFLPLARKFGEFAQRFTPQNALQETATKLELAGNPRGLEPATLWIFRFILPVFLGGVLIFVFSVSNIKWDWGRKGTITAVAVAWDSTCQKCISIALLPAARKLFFELCLTRWIC